MVEERRCEERTGWLLFATQDQALKTSAVRKYVDKDNIGEACRSCGERDETAVHIVSECKMLSQKEYKTWRHDKVAVILHWKLGMKLEFEVGEKWYDHKAESVLENEEIKILWNIKVQTDKVLEHSRHDIFVFEYVNWLM